MKSKSVQFLRVAFFFAAMMVLNYGNVMAANSYIDNPAWNFRSENASNICNSFAPGLFGASTTCVDALNVCKVLVSSNIQDTLVRVCEEFSDYWECGEGVVIGTIIGNAKLYADINQANNIRSACPSPSPAPAPAVPVIDDNVVAKALTIVVTNKPGDLKAKAGEICEALAKTTVKSKACFDAVATCVSTSEPKLRTALNDRAVTPRCAVYDNAKKEWTCSFNRWNTIEGEIEGASADPIAKACTADVSKAPSAPGPTPSATPPSSGPLSSSSADKATSEDKTTGCSLNPLALGNVWSGLASYLPFFMLVLVFGFKRKDK